MWPKRASASNQSLDGTVTQGYSLVLCQPGADPRFLDLDKQAGMTGLNQYITQWMGSSNYGIYQNLSAGGPDRMSRVSRLRGESTLRETIGPNRIDKHGILNECFRAFEEFPWVRRVFEARAEFGAAGFAIDCKNKAQLKFANQIAFGLDFDDFCHRFLLHLAIGEAVFPVWKYYQPGDERTLEMDRLDVRYVPKFMGLFHHGVLEPAGRRNFNFYPGKVNAIRKVAQKSNPTPEDIVQAAQWPDKVIRAALDNKPVLFSELSEYGWDCAPCFKWTTYDWEAWPMPSLWSILPDLVYVSMCESVDFNAISQTKAGIVLWQIGPKEINPNAIPATLPPSTKELEKIEKLFLRQLNNQLPNLFARKDLEITWVVPPETLFNLTKYKAAQARILDALNYPEEFWPVGLLEGGGGRAYANAVTAIKPFKQQIDSDRGILKRWMERFFWRLCVRNRIGNRSPMEVQLDPNVLVDEAQIIARLRMISERGLGSNKTIVEALGLNSETEIQRKTEELVAEKKTPGLLLPHFSTTRGSSPTDQGGRPSTDAEPNPASEDQPRPSRPQ